MTNQYQSTSLSLFAALLLEAAQRLGVKKIPNSPFLIPNFQFTHELVLQTLHPRR